MPYDAIIIGASIVDIPAGPVDASVFDTGSHPVDRLAFQVGGDAINEATVLSHLGADIKLISKIGRDPGGEFILNHCRRHSIDTTSMVTDPDMDTGINIVLIEKNGERSFIASSDRRTSTFLSYRRVPCYALQAFLSSPTFRMMTWCAFFPKQRNVV